MQVTSLLSVLFTDCHCLTGGRAENRRFPPGSPRSEVCLDTVFRFDQGRHYWREVGSMQEARSSFGISECGH